MTYQRILDALGDPTRRAIVERLRAGPQAVGVLARELPVSRPAVSQHLRVLKDAGLVSDRQVGTRRIYSIDPAGPARLRDYAESLWERGLARFKEAAERGAPPAKRLPTGRRRGKRGVGSKAAGRSAAEFGAAGRQRARRRSTGRFENR